MSGEDDVREAYDRLASDAQKVDSFAALRNVEGARAPFGSFVLAGGIAVVVVAFIAVGILTRGGGDDVEPASTAAPTSTEQTTATTTPAPAPSTTPPTPTTEPLVTAPPLPDGVVAFEVAAGPLVVRDVPDDDVLNLRSGPGVAFDIVATRANGETVTATGRGATAEQDGATWVEIDLDGTLTWANARFLGISSP